MRPITFLLLAIPGLAPAVEPRPTGAGAVDVRTFQFAPDTVRITAGETVTWVNRDQVEHTVTGGTPDARAPGWSERLPSAGSTTSRRFDRPGSWTYFCDRHAFMRGTVIVSPTRQETPRT